MNKTCNKYEETKLLEKYCNIRNLRLITAKDNLKNNEININLINKYKLKNLLPRG
jgi:hypothetical protein